MVSDRSKSTVLPADPALIEENGDDILDLPCSVPLVLFWKFWDEMHKSRIPQTNPNVMGLAASWNRWPEWPITRYSVLNTAQWPFIDTL